jgi:hypothetical protein
MTFLLQCLFCLNALKKKEEGKKAMKRLFTYFGNVKKFPNSFAMSSSVVVFAVVV